MNECICGWDFEVAEAVAGCSAVVPIVAHQAARSSDVGVMKDRRVLG